jgi:hypothetical protein
MSQTKPKIICVVILDCTGSMGPWKDGLFATLNPFIQAMAVTQLIDGIAILTYRDYDLPPDQVCKWCGFASCKNPDEQKKIVDFVNKINACAFRKVYISKQK